MLACGTLYRLSPLEPPTNATGSGFSVSMNWPSPCQRDHKGPPLTLEGWHRSDTGKLRDDSLDRAVMLEAYGLPLLDAGLPDEAPNSTIGNRPDSPEPELWKTPQASDAEGGVMEWMGGKNGHYKLRDHVHKGVPKDQQRGHLNPDWDECLMGLPVGWTQIPRVFTLPRTARGGSKRSGTE
jgi:hypothetical protein